MLGFSGIGVVIENVLKRIILKHPDLNFHLLANSKSNTNYDWLSNKNVFLSRWEASIYSLRQQITPIPQSPFEIDITWCPHYDVSRQLTGPLLVTIHDVLHLDNHIMKRSLIQRIYAQLMMRYAKYHASRIVFDSNFTKNQFARFVGVNNIDTQVIWLGVDPKWFDVNWKPKSGLDRYVVFVGNAMVHKNLKTLIRAIVEYGKVKLIIVGNASGLKTLDHDSVELASNNSDLIEVTGRIDDQRLMDIIARAALLVSPSLYEGFSLTPLEALAAGVPVAISDIPVHREVYNNVASFFEPQSVTHCIETISSSLDKTPGDESLRKAFARQFDWDTVADKYFSAFLELTNRGRLT